MTCDSEINFYLFVFRRDKTLNYFSIMVRKRCRNDEEPDKGNDDGENVKVKTSKKKGKDLVILLLMLLKKSFKMNGKEISS